MADKTMEKRSAAWVECLNERDRALAQVESEKACVALTQKALDDAKASLASAEREIAALKEALEEAKAEGVATLEFADKIAQEAGREAAMITLRETALLMQGGSLTIGEVRERHGYPPCSADAERAGGGAVKTIGEVILMLGEGIPKILAG